jgi:hypothetical protein
VQPGWQGRAALWLVAVEAARANRQEFPKLPTAWVPHSIGNTMALWLPELLDALDHTVDLKRRTQGSPTAKGLYQSIRDICVDNPGWGLYVAPLALGYSLSHPKFNIYKGEMGEFRLFGFGLDSIPHSGMAFTLTLLIQHGVAALERNLPEASPLHGAAHALAAQPALTSAVVLAVMSGGWEAGEMWAREEELRRMDGDESAVNMEWSMEDMVTDLLSNALGWLAAATLEARRGAALPSGFAPTAASD